MGCSLEEAIAFKDAYAKGFPGIAQFKARGSKFVRDNGYIVICKATGHKLYWWDWEEWKKRQDSFTKEFWDDYKANHKGTGDNIARMVSMHFKAASKYDRLSLNVVTQGTGIIILKAAMTAFFNWIVDTGNFGTIKIVNLVHDEACVEYPETMPEVATKLKQCMEEAAAKYCTKVPIPAEPEVGTCWIH